MFTSAGCGDDLLAKLRVAGDEPGREAERTHRLIQAERGTCRGPRQVWPRPLQLGDDGLGKFSRAARRGVCSPGRTVGQRPKPGPLQRPAVSDSGQGRKTHGRPPLAEGGACRWSPLARWYADRGVRRVMVAHGRGVRCSTMPMFSFFAAVETRPRPCRCTEKARHSGRGRADRGGPCAGGAGRRRGSCRTGVRNCVHWRRRCTHFLPPSAAARAAGSPGPWLRRALPLALPSPCRARLVNARTASLSRVDDRRSGP
jgi:hypothetical protein